MRRDRLLKVLFVMAVWIAFWTFGVMLHHLCANGPFNECGWTEISGMDSEGYVAQYRVFRNIFTFHLRHPFACVFLLPVFAVSSFVNALFGSAAADIATYGFFSLVSALSCWLVWQVSGRFIAALLWLAIPYMWIVGGGADSFGLSQFLLLLTLWLVRRGNSDWRTYAALSVAAGGVTLTNGLKPALAFLTLRNPSRRPPYLRLMVIGLVVAGLGMSAMICKWVFIHHFTLAQGFHSITYDITQYFAPSLSLFERLSYSWESFFCEPIFPHGSLRSLIGAETIAPGYGRLLGSFAFVPHVLVASVLVLAVRSAWINRRERVIRALLAMISVDFFLHLVVAWGVLEGQIYCAHWIFALPILLAYQSK